MTYSNGLVVLAASNVLLASLVEQVAETEKAWKMLEI
jgi:hypothetical protein